MERIEKRSRETRKERYERRKNALQTVLAGLLIARGNSISIAERKAAQAMRADWQLVRQMIERLGYSYMDMEFKGA